MGEPQEDPGERETTVSCEEKVKCIEGTYFSICLIPISDIVGFITLVTIERITFHSEDTSSERRHALELTVHPASKVDDAACGDTTTSVRSNVT